MIVLALIGGFAAAFVVYRSVRLVNVARDWRTDIRYLLQEGGTIGEAPASETFGTDFLDAMFGGDPELLDQIKSAVDRGLYDDPSLNLGEVAALVVTYHRNQDGKAEDVVVHAVGGFSLGKRKPGFHKDGYFAHQLDERLWQTGNTMLSLVGRDIVVFSDSDDKTRKQEELIESILSGEIVPLAQNVVARPLYYNIVFPDPERIVPPQMRKHIQAMILKGHLAQADGSFEHIILAKSPESANYSLSLLHDIRVAALVWLRAKMKGQVQQTEWGPVIDPWWAYEFGNTIDNAVVEKEQNILRMSVTFERVMVNAVLKTIERMGRDMAQTRGSLDERLDPRLVDARMKSKSPLHYWSDAHRWGPNWPIAAPTNGTTETQSAPVSPESAPAVSQPL